MNLTHDLAKKYASYRDRFLGGSGGLYAGFPEVIPDPCRSTQRYVKNQNAPFMVKSDNPLTDQGTFLHVDQFIVADTEDLEKAQIERIKFGDNTVYASVALVCFTAEHVITGFAEPLEIAIGIALSFQRLGSKQKGFGESGSPPFGFMLRADSPDRAKGKDEIDENICSYGDGTGETAYQLAPSFDQYAGILSCCLFVKQLLLEAPIPTSTEIRDRRQELIRMVEERTSRTVKFLAKSTNYTIRWEAGGAIHQPINDRGPYCHHMAWPMARIAAATIDGDVNQYGKYLGEVTLFTAITLRKLLVEEIAKVIKKVNEFLIEAIWERFVHDLEQEFGEDWGAIGRFFNIVEVVRGKFDSDVLGVLIEKVIEPIIQQLNAWGGIPATAAANEFLAQQLFDLFVTGSLLDTSDQPFENLKLRLTVSRLFELIGGVTLPPSIDIDIPLKFEPDRPDWWKEELLGLWQGPIWQKTITKFEIPLGALLDIELIIPMTGFMRYLVSIWKPESYLPFHAYNLLAASKLFGQVGNTDARELAWKYDNSWFMALAHRFFEVEIDAHGVKAVLNILESAPDTFPNGRGAARWNQDFRWIRGFEDKSSAALYSGLDFMAPLMIACSIPSDASTNRDILVDALSPKNEEFTTMGPFILPFQGPISNKQIFSPKAGGTQLDTTIYIAVIFDRPVGNNTLTLTIPTLTGGTEDVPFKQDERCSKLIAAPLTDFGIVIKDASETAKGNIVISTSD